MGEGKEPDRLAAETSPDWSDLKVFLYAAERQSIRAAARDLGISQPTASQRIRALEAKLGVMLFVRQASGILLTDAGREIFDHARAMQNEAAAIERRVRMRDGRAEGRVRVAAPDGLAGAFLGPHLERFYAANAGIALTLDAGVWPGDPLPEEVDVSLQYEPREQDGFVAEIVGYAHYAPFASKRFVQANGMPGSLGEIAKLPRLHHVAHTRQRETWDPALLQAHGRPILETNSSFALDAAVRAGLGFCFAPTWWVRGMTDLVMLTEKPLASLKIWLVYHEEIARIERVRRAIGWLKLIFDAADNPWFRDPFVHPDRFARS